MDGKSQSSTCSKENCFVALSVGDDVGRAGMIKYKCLRCNRLLSSKRNVLVHLHSAHHMSPVKRLNKKYLHSENPHAHVPRSTLYRWKKEHIVTRRDESKSSECKEMHTENDSPTSLLQPNLTATPRNSAAIDVELSALEELQDIESGASCWKSPVPHSTPCGWLREDESGPSNDRFPGEEMSNDGWSNCVSECVSNTEELSDDEASSLSSRCSESTDSHSTCSCESYDSTIVDDSDDEQFKGTAQLSQQEQTAFAMLSVFTKHNLSAAASKDILIMMKKLFPDSDTLANISYESLWKVCGETSFREYHYCHQCNAVFPEDHNIFRCASPGCDGLRYMGPDSRQTSSKIPRHSFVLANIDRQLQQLIKASDNWEQIRNTKHTAKSSSNGPISDITTASCYQRLCAEDSFLAGEKNISAIFNTDGLCLYSSSRIEIWPIFLAINELPPARRFARENILLVGMWQGKGKPPFYQYTKAFSDEVNRLYHEGVHVDYPEQGTVKLAVICGTLDLPAKAGVLNMTQYNGAYACILCEEPGMTVEQGNGHSRCFPYRSSRCLHPVRDKQSIKANMDKATDQNRQKGFRGKSGLLELTSLDLSKGILPDYMHCVLLGVTKTLMHKWFSPTQSGKEYFVGKKLQTISKRLMSIKPSDLLERLPRDLEKHYHSLKATEYQAWLLYYCIACMTDILPRKYLQHVALLAEGIHILLGHSITNDDLERASALLDEFYCQFAPLYGQGSCGLNVHNIGAHLCQCVQHFGPLWAWSCFPFEDSNSFILHAVHGTGNVTKQVLRYRNALSVLRASMTTARGKQWTNMKKADDCMIAGSIQNLPVDNTQLILQKLWFVQDVNRLKKVLRVQVGRTQLYSKMYKRMEKKICYVILTKNGEVVSIEYFVLDLNTNKVYAFVHILSKCDPPQAMEGGKHLQYVRESQDFDVIHVQDIQEKLFLIKPSTPVVINLAYVVRSPNPHGHAVFK